MTTNFCTQEEHDFLKRVAIGRAGNKVLPEPPIGMSIVTIDQIRRAGGVLQWAFTRREWKELMASQGKVIGKTTTKARGSAKATDPDEKFDNLRTSLIRAVLLAKCNGICMPPIPRKLRDRLADVTQSPEKLVAWAEANRAKLDAKTLKKITPATGEEHVSSFVKGIATADASGHTIPNVPRKLRAKLGADITRAGGIRKWAEAHPSYVSHLDAAKAKRALKASSRAHSRPAPETQEPIVVSQQPKAAVPERISKNGLSRRDEAELEQSVLRAVLPPGKRLTSFELASSEKSVVAILRVDAKRRFGARELLPLERYPSHVAIANRVINMLQVSRAKKS